MYDPPTEGNLNEVERSFRIEGASGLGRRPRPRLVGPILASVEDALLDSVRMGFLHTSRARGRVPGFVRSAAEVRFVGHSADQGATLLHFEVPTLGSVAADFFRQPSLWDEGPQPDETAFELFGAALHDVAMRRTDSSSFDPGLLKRIYGYRGILGRGVERITMPDTSAPRRGSIDTEVVQAACELSAVTPPSRRIRVTGRVDVMAASQGLLKLAVGSREFVTALWEGDGDVEALREYFNRDVVVEGLGVFRPSGSLLRLEADAIAPAVEEDEFFRRIPTGTIPGDYVKAARGRASTRSAYRELRGMLRGDESDQEFDALMAELR